MKFRILALLLPLVSIAMAAEPSTLEHHRWNHRLLVIPTPTPAIEAALTKHQERLKERHVITIRLIPGAQSAIDKQIAGRFQLTASSKEILLIGKDGRTTTRWPISEFTFEKLFQRIDTMPMRQREMRNQSQSQASQ